MDKYNNPSDDVNNNNNNPWDYRPDQIDDTQEIHVIDNTEKTGEDAANNGPDHTPEYNPSSYYNASETEHKSHIGRNLFIGAVAVAAVAGAVSLFNGSQSNATTPSLSSQEGISAEYNSNSTVPSTDPNVEIMNSYEDEEAYTDGLSVDEFAESCGFKTVADAYNYYKDDLGGRLRAEVDRMGYHLDSDNASLGDDGKPYFTTGGTFDCTVDGVTCGMVGIAYNPQENNFHIQISVMPSTGDYVADFYDDTIPTAAEAAQIVADSL